MDFTLPESGPVHLAIYDSQGRLVRTLINQTLPAGTYQRNWDARINSGAGAAAGIYYLRLQAGGAERKASLLLLR